MTMTRRACALAMTTALCSLALPAMAQDFPSRPITILVGYGAGGPTDVIARIFADEMSQAIGQPVVVENLPGAGGEIASVQMLDSRPDGYTLMWAAASQLVYAPLMQENPRIKPLEQMEMISLTAGFPYVISVPASSPATDLQAFIAAAKDSGTRMTYGSSGVGTANHLAGEWFAGSLGVEVTHIPYAGDAASVLDLAAGRNNFTLITPSVVMPMIEAGTVRGLAVTSTERLSFLPDVPTTAEAGLPGFEVELFNGLVGPLGMPQEVIDLLADTIIEIQQDPEMEAKLAGAMTYPVIKSGDELDAYLADLYTHWADVIAQNNIPKLP